MLRTIVGVLFCLFWVKNGFGNTTPAKLTIKHVVRNFYVYTTYHLYEKQLIPAHGMYLVTDSGVLLLDTPWDSTQFQPLLDSIQIKHGQQVKWCIATHWHSDRTDGLDYYRQQGIKTYTTVLTDDFCRKNNQKRASYLMTKDTLFQIGSTSFEVYYPGGGHTEDNIVVWFGKEKILYGGCLIKGAEAKDLGYLGDANVAEYANTLRRVQKRFPRPKWILVSHHDWTNNHSLAHSIQLAKQLKKQHPRS